MRTIRLPGDGMDFLTGALASPWVLVLFLVVVLTLPRLVSERAPLTPSGCERDRSMPPAPGNVHVLCALGTVLLAELILPRVGGGALAGIDLLLRNLLVLLVGFDLLPRLLGRPPRTMRQLAGRLRPPLRLGALGGAALVVTGMGLWGLSWWYPLTLRIGPAKAQVGVAAGAGLILGVGLIPLTEELMLRGGLYRWLRGCTGPNTAVLLTAGLFALLHVPQNPFLYTFLGGLVMTGLFEFTGSVLPGFALHAGMNFLLLYGGWLIR